MLVVSDQQRPASGQPRQGSLNDPAASLSAPRPALRPTIFTDGSDVAFVAETLGHVMSHRVVVSSVEAQVLFESLWVWSSDNDRLNRFLKQLRQIILKRIIHLFTKISEGDDQEKIDNMQKTYGSVLKLGAVEDTKNRDKLAGLTRYVTNQRNNASFDQVS